MRVYSKTTELDVSGDGVLMLVNTLVVVYVRTVDYEACIVVQMV